jgi:hypothetical protein
MNAEHRFELRVSDAVWAILSVSQKGMVLEHNLDHVRIAICPGVTMFDEDGKQLHPRQGEQLLIGDPNGLVRLKLNVDNDGTLVDVVDPRRIARLAVELRGPGSAGNNRIQEGGLVLTLKPIDQAG